MNVHTLKIISQYSLIDYYLQSQLLLLHFTSTKCHLIDRYARYGEVSPKVDVYAFGIVLYELVSAKEAIVRSTEFTDAQGLVYLVIYPSNQFSVCNIAFEIFRT